MSNFTYLNSNFAMDSKGSVDELIMSEIYYTNVFSDVNDEVVLVLGNLRTLILEDIYFYNTTLVNHYILQIFSNPRSMIERRMSNIQILNSSMAFIVTAP